MRTIWTIGLLIFLNAILDPPKTDRKDQRAWEAMALMVWIAIMMDIANFQNDQFIQSFLRRFK